MTYASYHVGLKAILRKGDEILVLHSPQRESWQSSWWDLPGGRIDETEHEMPLTQIVQREVREELGEDVSYELGEPVFVCRRYIPHKDWHVFLVFYEAKYLGGEIRLSEEHTGYEWIKAKDYELKSEDFVSKEEYEAFKRYFKELRNENDREKDFAEIL